MEDLHRSVWPAVRPPALKWLAQQWSQNQQPSCYKSIVSGSPTRTGETFSITRLLANSSRQLTASFKNKAQIQDVESQFLSVLKSLHHWSLLSEEFWAAWPLYLISFMRLKQVPGQAQGGRMDGCWEEPFLEAEHTKGCFQNPKAAPVNKHLNSV